MYGLLSSFVVVRVGVANSLPFVLKGKATGAKYFVSGKCRVVFCDLEWACYRGGEICVCYVEGCDNCVNYGCGKRVMICCFGVTFGECVVITFIEQNNFSFKGLGWGA